MSVPNNIDILDQPLEEPTTAPPFPGKRVIWVGFVVNVLFILSKFVSILLTVRKYWKLNDEQIEIYEVTIATRQFGTMDRIGLIMALIGIIYSLVIYDKHRPKLGWNQNTFRWASPLLFFSLLIFLCAQHHWVVFRILSFL